MSTGRLLVPREYGAYAEMAFPLLTGFLLGGLSAAGVGFSIAVTASFLLNEPLSVLKGLRGERQRLELRVAARRQAVLLAVIATAGGGAAMALASTPARLAALIPGALALLLAPAVLWGRPKALGSELIMAAAFAFMLPPVALAGNAAAQPAVATGVWVICFFLATIGVHAVKARARRDLGSPWTVWASPLVSLFVAVAALVAIRAGMAPTPAAYGVIPAALVTLGAAVARIHPRHLKRVGWSLVAGNVVTLVLLVRA